jgi:hypothetical protein
VIGIAFAQVTPNAGLFFLIEIIDHQLLHVVERVCQILGPCKRTPALNQPAGDVENHKRPVHDSHRGLKEIVVVFGNKLPDFIDKRAEPNSTQDNGNMRCGAAEKREQHPDRHSHQKTAP